MNLPVQLTKNPLVSVIFEIRFESTIPMSTVLPGLLYKKFKGGEVKKTPHAEIPDVVRQNDPQFAYVPLISMSWGEYHVNIGDKVLLLGCNMPYKGWGDFSLRIKELIKFFSEIEFNVVVERYSLKYVDLIRYNFEDDVKNLLNFSVIIGNQDVNIKFAQLRSESHDEKIITITQFSGQAEAVTHDGSNQFGMVIDIDCIKPVDNINLDSLSDSFERELDALHFKVKQTFFNFLTEEGLEYLGAVYA